MKALVGISFILGFVVIFVIEPFLRGGLKGLIFFWAVLFVIGWLFEVIVFDPFWQRKSNK